MNSHPAAPLLRAAFFSVFVGGLFLTSTANLANAQNQANDNRREYIRSSSPTKNGGRVVSETVSGETMVRIARSSSSNSRSGTGRESSARRESNSMNNSDFGSATAADRRSANDSAYPYPYPDLRPGAPTTAFRQSANVAPSLRFPPNNRMAQCNCNGVPVPPNQLQFPPQNFQQQAFQPGFSQQGFQQGFQQPFAAGAPNYPLQPGLGVPQFNQTGGNWWSPFLTGSGYYTPLLNFRNMPQGSYLGQGIIGQPTAYVDSQPLRNLLRYISP